MKRLLTLALAVALTACATSDRAARPITFELIASHRVAGEVAEIVTATPDAAMLVYADSEGRQIGFVNIADPARPTDAGLVAVDGEATSVAVTSDGRFALAVVAGRSNQIAVIDITTRRIARVILLSGQPDSIAVSPDGKFAAVAIENERDEDVQGGALPQMPPGSLAVLRLQGEAADWTLRYVNLEGIAARFPEDPEPELVRINDRNEAAIALQENNHVVIVDLEHEKVIGHFSAGSVTQDADTKNDGAVAFSGRIVDARREPDGVAWTSRGSIVTANEGDYEADLLPGQFVGGRGFSIFDRNGRLLFDSGSEVERIAARHGRYPDEDSPRAGVEIESVEVKKFFGRELLFAAAERGDFAIVYALDDERRPTFLQFLPTGDSPEGILALPRRNLFVTANELDGTLSIFRAR